MLSPGMGLFGNRQSEVETLRARIVTLEAEVEKSAKLVRTAIAEVTELSTRVYRHLKATEARARRELEAPGANQERTPAAAQPGDVTPPPASVPWGARARWRRRRQPLDLSTETIEDDTQNGVHS